MNVKRLSTVLLAGAAIFAIGCGGGNNKVGELTKDEAIAFVKSHYTSKDDKIPSKVHIILDFSDYDYGKPSTDQKMGDVCQALGFTFDITKTEQHYEADSTVSNVIKNICSTSGFKPVNEQFIEDCYLQHPEVVKFSTNGQDLSVTHNYGLSIVGVETSTTEDHFDNSGYLDSRYLIKCELNNAQMKFNYSVKSTLTY